MKTKEKSKKLQSQEEIDQIVTAQADDNAAWEEPIVVQPTIFTSLSLPAELAARAAFIARLHRAEHVEEWLMHNSEVKRELAMG